jgi:hypothetical protein
VFIKYSVAIKLNEVESGAVRGAAREFSTLHSHYRSGAAAALDRDCTASDFDRPSIRVDFITQCDPLLRKMSLQSWIGESTVFVLHYSILDAPK